MFKIQIMMHGLSCYYLGSELQHDQQLTGVRFLCVDWRLFFLDLLGNIDRTQLQFGADALLDGRRLDIPYLLVADVLLDDGRLRKHGGNQADKL